MSQAAANEVILLEARQTLGPSIMLHRGGRGKGGKGGGAPPPPAGPGHTKVYVGNLSWESSWQDLKDHFRQVGEVLHADIMTGADGRSKGCGLVTFASPHDAARAISTLHDSVLHSRSIFVREDREAALPGLPAPGVRAAPSGLASSCSCSGLRHVSM